MQSILEIKGLKKTYGKTQVLKGIDLSVREGEILSVLGPSGCGKSTLLRIIAGILEPSEGSVCIRGEEVSGRHRNLPTEKRGINMVFQDFALWPHLKVEENILYGLKLRKTPKEECDTRLREMTELLHLDGLLGRYPAELSGGQQQRVAIARALITKPAIVLLDEPLCNLDIQLRIEMRTEMAYLFRKLGTTVFHVTHDPSEAFAMADRIIIMSGGYIDQAASPVECYMKPQTALVAGLLGAGNDLRSVKLLDAAEGAADQATDAGTSVRDCRISVGEDEMEGMYFGGSGSGAGCMARFRPEDARWEGSLRDGNAFYVRVLMSTFEGGCFRIRVADRAGDEFNILNDSAIAEDTEGYVSVPKDKLYVYDRA